MDQCFAMNGLYLRSFMLDALLIAAFILLSALGIR